MGAVAAARHAAACAGRTRERTTHRRVGDTQRFVSEVRAAALAVEQQLIVLDVSSNREIETAFTTLVQRGAGAVHVGVGPFLVSQRERIVALAARHALPAIYNAREFTEIGGLISYGASLNDSYRQAGVYNRPHPQRREAR